MNSNYATTPFTVNGRTYHPPARPIVVICVDGCADEYLDAAFAKGRMPNLSRISRDGFRGRVRGALPSFTNVNNSSIVTGAPPSVHGIGGNFFLDPATNEEVMMNSSRFLRAETILAHASRAGRKVGFVTAKDKLREILSAGMTGIAFSAERANLATIDVHGIDDVEVMVGKPTPPIYSGAASLYVLEAGVALLRSGRADFLYLSTTDYMQHKFGYDEEEIMEFYAVIDDLVGQLIELGAIVGITADHGMNAKQNLDGSPCVVFIETLLKERFGPEIRVILPITDPYVVHHGALGSFAVVHLPHDVTAEEVSKFLLEIDGITEVLDRETAARKMELPSDRIGDLVVLSGRNTTLGKTPEAHDLSALEGGLRSHGGRYEEMVPLLVSEPLNELYKRKGMGDPRNFDVFDFTINGANA